MRRQATVRYYHRMNPEKMYPFLVVISRDAIRKAAQRGVSQAGGTFRATLDSFVVIDLILPGCECHPAQETVRIRAETVAVTFCVIPKVLGRLISPRVVLRQKGRILATVPLEICVVKQTFTVVAGVASIVLPFLTATLKHYHLDFDSQQEEGFGLYAHLIQWVLHSLSPEVLMGLLIALTAAAYLWLRPWRRGVFWDIAADKPGRSRGGVVAAIKRACQGAVSESLRRVRGAVLLGGGLGLGAAVVVLVAVTVLASAAQAVAWALPALLGLPVGGALLGVIAAGASGVIDGAIEGFRGSAERGNEGTPSV